MRVYNLVTVLKFLIGLTFLFKLICLQVVGILGYEPWWVGIVTFIAIVALTSLSKAFNAGEESIGLGLLSIAAFIVFIAWAVFTAPSGQDLSTAHGK